MRLEGHKKKCFKGGGSFKIRFFIKARYALISCRTFHLGNV